MDVSQTGPLALAERRLAWLDGRQRLLAQNVANADTPGYRPRDSVPFAELLARRVASPRMALTDRGHLLPARATGPEAQAARLLERTPDGNGVSLDDQAVRIAETDQAHALAMGLHRKYMTLFRTALGRP